MSPHIYPGSVWLAYPTTAVAKGSIPLPPLPLQLEYLEVIYPKGGRELSHPRLLKANWKAQRAISL